jgi:hypothetical protein
VLAELLSYLFRLRESKHVPQFLYFFYYFISHIGLDVHLLVYRYYSAHKLYQKIFVMKHYTTVTQLLFKKQPKLSVELWKLKFMRKLETYMCQL